MSVTLRAPVAALLALAGTLALVTPSGADERFDPSFEVVLAQPAPQSPTELTIHFGLERGLQFSTIVFFIPRDWGVARGEEIPVGTKLALVESTETFGFINSACDMSLSIVFELFNASLDARQTVSFQNTDPIGGDPVAYGTADFAEDKDANGMLDAIDHYPDFLSPTLGEARPIARLAGVTPVAGIPILLQLLIFAPGTRIDLPTEEFAELTGTAPQSGYPMMMVIQNLHNPDTSLQPGPITDYCSPRKTSVSFFPSGGGPALLVNPQAGSYAFTFAATSKREADWDGIENSLDTCLFEENIGNATIQGDGDSDGDGLDVACDPDDEPITGLANSDIDGDGYLNRQDNCPLVPNGPSADNQSDRDLDDIGDVCDPISDAPQDKYLVSVLSDEVVVGDASGSGGPPNAAACPRCYRPGGSPGETDTDGAGGQLAVAIGLITLGAGAAAVVAGSGALYLIRRRRS